MGSSHAAQRKCDMCHAGVAAIYILSWVKTTTQNKKERKQGLTLAQGTNVVVHLLTTESTHGIKEVGVILFTVHWSSKEKEIGFLAKMWVCDWLVDYLSSKLGESQTDCPQREPMLQEQSFSNEGCWCCLFFFFCFFWENKKRLRTPQWSQTKCSAW